VHENKVIMQSVRQQQSGSGLGKVLLFLGLAFLLWFFFLKSDGSKRRYENSTINLSFAQEVSHLQLICERFIKTDNHLGSGGLKFLDQKRSTFEDLILSSKSHACLASNETKVIWKMVKLLEKTNMYKESLSSNQWQSFLPALKELESHMEERNNNIEELRIMMNMINDLILTDEESSKMFNEATSVMKNFYICLDFAFTEVPNVYKLLFNLEDSTIPNNVLSYILQWGFRLVLIAIIWMIAPKTIWKLHLFVMKVCIFFFCIVICVGFYNFFSTFMLSFQYQNLRTVIDDDLFLVQNVHLAKNIWSLPQFLPGKSPENLEFLSNIKERKLLINQDLTEDPSLVKSNEEFIEKLKLKVSKLEANIENSKYDEVNDDVRAVFEKFKPLMKNVLNLVDMISNSFPAQKSTSTSEDLLPMKNLFSYLEDIEDTIDNYKMKIVSQVKKLNKITNEILMLKESHQQDARRGGTLSTMIGAASYPLIRYSENSVGYIVTLGLGGTVYAYSTTWSRNSKLEPANEVLHLLKQISKQLLSLLDGIQPLRMSTSHIILNDIFNSGSDSMLIKSECQKICKSNFEVLAQLQKSKKSVTELLI